MKKPLTIPKLKAKVWKVFSLYIRQKYAKRGMVRCYTCPVVKPIKEMQCGHGLGGRGNSILFDASICRPQCVSCNIFRGGNYDIFHDKLIKENGVEWFQKKVKQKQETKQFTRSELEEKYQYYNSRLK